MLSSRLNKRVRGFFHFYTAKVLSLSVLRAPLGGTRFGLDTHTEHEGRFCFPQLNKKITGVVKTPVIWKVHPLPFP